ncbi:MAG: fructose-1,6-bisphosphatase I [Oceanicoccus sp.]|jgi:fructose-1,6-bisphosphatase I
MQRLSSQLQSTHTDAELVTLIDTIAIACKEITQRLQPGAITGVLGSAGAENVQGETQKKLDVISNDVLKDYLLSSEVVRAIASEEEESIVAGNQSGSYLVAFDPLDGSSNVDINCTVGTIFSIFNAPPSSKVSEEDFLQPGRNQAAAGYVIYGATIMLVLTTGEGVQMYTLDQRIGEFVMTTEQVSIAEDTNEFAINMSNQRHWAEPMQSYIADLLAGEDGPRQKNYNMRWVAAMAADVHRIMCRGGLFTYPWDKREPNKAGKLRLMYEANPMSFLVEQAGGSAWTDKQAIMDVQPEHIHQRVPVILGAKNEVTACLKYHQD